MRCKICNNEYENLFKFSRHLLNLHDITAKDYYDTYQRKDENEGKCKICGKPTRFKSVELGYKIYCGKECHKEDQRKLENRAKVSKNFKEIYSDPEMIKLKSDSSLNQWKNDSYRKLISDKAKQRWQDPNYRSKHEKILKDNNTSGKARQGLINKINNDSKFREELKARSSVWLKSLWKDNYEVCLQRNIQMVNSEEFKANMQAFFKNHPEITEKLSEKFKVMWQDPQFREYKTILSYNLMKKLNENPEFLLKQKQGIKELWNDPVRSIIAKKNMAYAMSEVWKRPGHKDKMVALINTPERNKKFGEDASVRWQDPDYRAKLRRSCAIIHINYNNEILNFDSSYEVSFWLYCIQNNINICRNTESYSYYYNGKKHFCTYDFNCAKMDDSNTVYKIEVKGDHINGKCIFNQVDDGLYAAIRNCYLDHDVQFITKQDLVNMDMPITRIGTFRLLERLGIEYTVKHKIKI